MFKNHDLVFFGYIEQLPDPNLLISYSEGKSDVIPLVKFKIIEGFKGATETKTIELSVSFSTTCEASMEKNIRIFVFASKNSEGVLETSKCSTFLAQKYKYENKEYGPTEQEVKTKLENLRKLMSNKAAHRDALPLTSFAAQGAHGLKRYVLNNRND